MVDQVVVDTSYLIELLDRGKKELIEYILDKEVLIPFVVEYEYLYGFKVIGKDINSRKKVLEGLGRIIWLNQEIMMKLLDLKHEMERREYRIPEADLIIWAIALIYNAPIITFDKTHFKEASIKGVEIITPD